MSAATTKLTRVRTSTQTPVTEAYLPALHDHATRPLAPDAPRSDDPDFALKNLLILAAIKAAHHLDNASGPDPLPIIGRLTASLTASICPAVPNTATLAFIDENARKRVLPTSSCLRELDAPNPADALRDGSLPSSDLPPPSPDPGALNSDDRSPSQAGCLRPPPAAPLPQRTTTTSVLPRLRTLATPPLPAPASPDTTPPHAFAQTSASALPRRRTLATPLQSAPASPGMTPPNGSAQTNARRDAFPVGTPVGSVRARLTFNTPADSAILDTPTRVSTKRISTARRSRVTFDPPADGVTPMRHTHPPTHTRMFSRRASTARRLARKTRSAAPLLRGSSTEASP
ncbi:unnamed protein product [Gadus morhua 'NCC']